MFDALCWTHSCSLLLAIFATFIVFFFLLAFSFVPFFLFFFLFVLHVYDGKDDEFWGMQGWRFATLGI